MGSLFFYLLFLFVLMLLCKRTGNSAVRKKKIIIAYILFCIVAGIRYGIGNDYVSYAPNCIYIASYFNLGPSLRQGLLAFSEDVEIAHIFFCWLFQWMKYPFVGLFFIYSVIQVGLLYLILKRNDDHYWGIFLFIIGEFMFCSWDGIRQFTAVLVIIYSYEYVKNNELFKYLACIGIAWLFHHSALFVLPAYLLRYLKINRWILIVILGIVTVMTASGLLQQYQDRISVYFDYLDEYSSYGSNASFTVVATSFQYRMRLLIVGLFYIFVLYFYPKGNSFYELLLTIGVSVFLFANNGLTLMRISWYFWTIAIIMVGPSFIEMKKRKASILRSLLVVVFLFIFSHDVITGSNTRGCSNYSTIFTGDLDHLPQNN